MPPLPGFFRRPDVLIIRRDLIGFYPFPDETVRPFWVPSRHLAVRQCHCCDAETKGVDGRCHVERGDGVVVFLARVCVDDPGMTVVEVTQYAVDAAVGAAVGSGIVAPEDEPWNADKGSCLAALVLQPEHRYLHKFGTPIRPGAFAASRKRFPPEEIARLLEAFEAHVHDDLCAASVDAVA
jgi:hypothetical protein